MLKNAARNLTSQQISEMAKRTRSGAGETRLPTGIVRLDRKLPLPASFAQQRLWFLAQLEPDSPVYNIPVGLRLRGPLNEPALRRALDEIIARHEVLRTNFYANGENIFQRISPEGTRFVLEGIDLPASPDGQLHVAQQAAQEFSAPFNLENDPLIRGRLLKIGAEDHALLLTVHHIVADGWSLNILSRELSALYNAYCRGQQSPLVPLSLQYADYAAWQRTSLSGEALHRSVAYWKRALNGIAPVIDLPSDRRRSDKPNSEFGAVPFRVDTDLAQRLKSLSQRLGLTLFMTMLSAWALVLSRLSGQDDIVIGVPVANRNQLEIENLIGFFTNTLALRVDLSGNPTVLQLLSRVRSAALSAQTHQDIAFEQVVDFVNPVRSLSHTPLFQVMFAWQNHEGMAFDLVGLDTEWLNKAEQNSPFDLTLNLREQGGGVDGHLKYVGSLFDRSTVERYAGYFVRALSEIAENSEQEISAVSILSDPERHKLLVTWNATQRDYPLDSCLHRLFEQQVARTPEAIAVSAEEGALTYAELNTRANQLAHYMIGLGIRPDSRVAICMKRSLDMVVSLYAVLKSGGAYVPLDPDYPPERLAYMLADCAPDLVLTHPPAREGLPAAVGGAVRILDISMAGAWPGEPASNPSVDVAPNNLAYIIYTSGSTGHPKGAMNEHRAVLNRILWMQETYRLNAADTVLQKTPFSFDVSVWEFFWPLAVGARLVVAKPEGHKDVQYLSSLIRMQRITTLHFVPSMLHLFLEDASASTCTGIKRIFCSGEALPKTLIDRFGEVQGGAELHNLYGPTEAAIDVTAWDCRNKIPANASAPPIGKPIANTRIYLLDGARNPVPSGATGEIYIGGTGVGRGYLNRPDLTEERFIPSPFVAGDRLYKTGDLGRYLADGTIDYLGRNDFQVKIRGFRIELGEIEARLLDHPSICDAVVLARDEGGEDKRLVGYYTSKTDAIVATEDLRRHLSATLPEYMVPAAYVRLDVLPLSSNGKLDRKALPAPDNNAYGPRVYEHPVGPVETKLARIWSEVLGVDPIGRHDNFFALGGHSLLAIRVLERMRRVGFKADMRAIFSAPILVDFAVGVEACETVIPSIARVDRNGLLAPSFAQQRLWFLAQIDGTSETYHIPLALRLKGALDEVAFVRALDGLVARHEPLRTTFSTIDGELFQKIGAGDSGFPLRREDLRGHALKAQMLAHQIEEEAANPFDLEHGPLVRGRLLRLEDDEYALLVTMHHIVSDGWSMAPFSRELSQLYRAYKNREPSPLPPLAIEYADYAAWQRQWLSGDALTGHSAYWRKTLAGAPTLIELPTDHRRPPRQNFAAGSIPIVFDEALTRDLKAFSQRHNLTLFMTILAGWALVLSRLSNQNDVVIGVPNANRNRLEIEGLIGFFVNMLALRIDLSGHPSFAELLGRVRTVALEAQMHQDLPFEQVVDLVRPARSLNHTPLFQVMFAWQNNEDMAFDLPGLEIGRLQRNRTLEKFDLTLNLGEFDGCVSGSLSYASSLFEHETAARYAGYLQAALAELLREPGQSAAGVPLLSPDERRMLLFDRNATEKAYAPDMCVHHLFEAQVERTPGAIAVTCEGASLSYAELNDRANRLAHHLIGLDVGPDSLVGICVERSAEMVIGLMAILKAGGAYVPLDPAYPPERLRYMVSDSAPVLVLTHGAARTSLDAALGDNAWIKLLDLEKDAQDWSNQPDTNPDQKHIGLTPHNLAYVIYTSGSTGQPKGAMNEHAGVVNRLLWMQDAYNIGGADSVLQKTPFSFDVSVWEFFWTLATGARLVIARPEGHKDTSYLASIIRHEHITVLHFVPSMLSSFVEEDDVGMCKSIAKVFCSGEALPERLLKRFQDIFETAELHNLYGPTEAAVDVTAWNCGSTYPGNSASPPIGRPISNMRIYLLDSQGNPVPHGVAGEICIGGVGVARGYWKRPELTAEKFIDSPFIAGDRLYKTGDLGRYLADGTIEYLGRNDFQVKLRGFRIELGEIEARLSSYPGIRETVVVARNDVSGDARLIAYYTAEGSDIPAKELRQYLSLVLPNYMLPAAFVRLNALPLTSSGKIDRKALPSPDGSASVHSEYEAPTSPVETALARIWSEVLGIERIGRQDNFFDLGGHSLLAVRVITRVRDTLGADPGLRALFEAPVLFKFCTQIEESKARMHARRKSAEERLSAMVAQMSDAEVEAHIQGVVR